MTVKVKDIVRKDGRGTLGSAARDVIGAHARRTSSSASMRSTPTATVIIEALALDPTPTDAHLDCQLRHYPVDRPARRCSI